MVPAAAAALRARMYEIVTASTSGVPGDLTESSTSARMADRLGSFHAARRRGPAASPPAEQGSPPSPDRVRDIVAVASMVRNPEAEAAVDLGGDAETLEGSWNRQRGRVPR